MTTTLSEERQLLRAADDPDRILSFVRVQTSCECGGFSEEYVGIGDQLIEDEKVPNLLRLPGHSRHTPECLNVQAEAAAKSNPRIPDEYTREAYKIGWLDHERSISA